MQTTKPGISTGTSTSGRRVRRALVAAGIVVGSLVPASGALAATYPDPGVGGTSTGSGAEVQGTTASRSSSSTLPFTGGDAIGLAVIGAGAAAAGAVMVRSSRRRNATA